MNKYLLLFGFLLILIGACNSYTSEQQAALERGSEIYIAHCISCHGLEGKGMNGAYPSLIKPQITKETTERAINLIRHGSGFDGGMKPISLSAQEVMDVVNYIQNTWGNKSEFIATISTE